MRLCGAYVLLVFLLGPGWTKNSKFVWKRPQYVMPWRRGANICAVEEVTGSRKRYYSECMTYMPRTICEKPTFIRYHCCTGYERVQEGDKGCEGVVPVVDLITTMENLHMNEFGNSLKLSGLDPTFQSEGAYTVFMPEDRAYRSMPLAKRQEVMTPRGAEELIRHHTVKKRHYLRQLINNIELPTLSQDNPSVRINRYSNGIVTVNCARIVVPDQIASNGIIHTTEKIVEPFHSRGTVMQTLLDEQVHQFGELITALIVTELGNQLRDDTKMFTVFAPTDAAFRNAPQGVMNRILGDKDLLQRLLQYHILHLEVCTAAILNKARVRTLEGQKVNLTCDINNRMRVNDIPVSDADIVTTNGVIHVLDEVLIPDAVKSLEDVLLELEQDEFLEYIQQAGLIDELRGEASGNFTVFVPSLEAFQSLTGAERHVLQTQPAAVRRVFQYHVVPGRITTNTILGESAVEASSASGRRGDSLLLRVMQQGKFSVNDAKIVSPDHEAFNGVVHVIDRIMRPPEDPASDMVKDMPQISKFRQLMDAANMGHYLSDPNVNHTILAPSNEAFDALPSDYMESLMDNRARLRKFLEYHMIPQEMYISVQRHRLQYRYPTITGDFIRMRTSRDDAGRHATVLNEYAEIQGDATRATNGVIYVISETLHCPCLDGEGFDDDDDDDDNQGGMSSDESEDSSPGESNSVVSKLKEQRTRLSSFLERLQETALHRYLMTFKGNLTVFAPSNEAFAELTATELRDFMSDSTKINKFLRYHVLEHPVYTDVMQPNFPYRYRTMAEEWLKLYKEESPSGGTITINERATINGGPYPSDNGVVYSIDKVLHCPCLDDTP